MIMDFDLTPVQCRLHLYLLTAAQEGIDLPESPSLPPSQEPLCEVAAVQPELPIEGLMLLAGDTTLYSGDKEDGKVNKECLRYDFGYGRCPLRPNKQVTPPRYMLYNVASIRLGYKHWV